MEKNFGEKTLTRCGRCVLVARRAISWWRVELVVENENTREEKNCSY